MSGRVVIDASVIVKALLPAPRVEPDRSAALAVLAAVGDAALEPLQPPHWLAEVTAVLARLDPESAEVRAELLHALELPVLDAPELYVEACRLATRLDHHLFDTLYHAVARCEPDTVCVTADEAYYRKARGLGDITLLRDFRLG
jgi:predicted nucleic acid-binding protein